MATVMGMAVGDCGSGGCGTTQVEIMVEPVISRQFFLKPLDGRRLCPSWDLIQCETEFNHAVIFHKDVEKPGQGIFSAGVGNL